MRMSNLLRSMCLAAICAVVPSLSAGFAAAAPMSALAAVSSAATDASSLIEDVQYRRRGGRRTYGIQNGRRYGSYRRNRNRNRRNYGRNAGIGAGVAIIGGLLLSEAARSASRGSRGGDWERCANTYRSFERRTGMYTGYDGVRRTCPYLR